MDTEFYPTSRVKSNFWISLKKTIFYLKDYFWLLKTICFILAKDSFTIKNGVQS